MLGPPAAGSHRRFGCRRCVARHVTHAGWVAALRCAAGGGAVQARVMRAAGRAAGAGALLCPALQLRPRAPHRRGARVWGWGCTAAQRCGADLTVWVSRVYVCGGDGHTTELHRPLVLPLTCQVLRDFGAVHGQRLRGKLRLGCDDEGAPGGLPPATAAAAADAPTTPAAPPPPPHPRCQPKTPACSFPLQASWSRSWRACGTSSSSTTTTSSACGSWERWCTRAPCASRSPMRTRPPPATSTTATPPPSRPPHEPSTWATPRRQRTDRFELRCCSGGAERGVEGRSTCTDTRTGARLSVPFVLPSTLSVHPFGRSIPVST